jgi:hypothetical protein
VRAMLICAGPEIPPQTSAKGTQKCAKFRASEWCINHIFKKRTDRVTSKTISENILCKAHIWNSVSSSAKYMFFA